MSGNNAEAGTDNDAKRCEDDSPCSDLMESRLICKGGRNVRTGFHSGMSFERYWSKNS
jgi:hypothetical protein